MDEVAQYNIARWRALAAANALFTRPALELDTAGARALVDPEGLLGALEGRRVLCLAAGGGKQSVAFALLGAHPTVIDLSKEQLERDRAAAAHHRVTIETVQGDMRDLSRLGAGGFDLVWQPYSINFVPDTRPVFDEVTRVLRPGGSYYLQFANPFASGLGTRDWNGEGYLIRRPYIDGAEVAAADEAWVYGREVAQAGPIPGPREYRHTLSTVINGLIERGFQLLHLSDGRDLAPDPNAPPGSWNHFTAFVPPWMAVWAAYRPVS